MIKNRVIELYPTDTKEILYKALEDSKNIMYTRNGRSTPIRTKTGIDNVYIAETSRCDYTIVVEPDKQQLEYFDYVIMDIKTAIETEFELDELKEFLNKNGEDKFLNAIQNGYFDFLEQYEIEEVYQYISNL